MKILITGSTGLLGQALIQRLAPSCEVVGVSRHAVSVSGVASHQVCDLTDPNATQHLVNTVKPDVVIHAQALSDVDRCEEEPHEAERCNVQALEHLCRALEICTPLLVALSTDYVFDGMKGSPYVESDEPKPLSVYGRSKLAGERVALRYPRAVVIRPSTLFGPGRMNFCDFLVQQLQQGKPVEAFSDQVTSPTYTEDLAGAIHALITILAARSLAGLPRIYHLTNAGGCSRMQFAGRIAELLGTSDALIRPIHMGDQRRPAPRPADSRLASEHVPTILGLTLRPWEDALRAHLQQTVLAHPPTAPTGRSASNHGRAR